MSPVLGSRRNLPTLPQPVNPPGRALDATARGRDRARQDHPGGAYLTAGLLSLGRASPNCGGSRSFLSKIPLSRLARRFRRSRREHALFDLRRFTPAPLFGLRVGGADRAFSSGRLRDLRRRILFLASRGPLRRLDRTPLGFAGRMPRFLALDPRLLVLVSRRRRVS